MHFIFNSHAIILSLNNLMYEGMAMSLTLAFDVYGTLINTHGVISRLQGFIGDKAQPFSYTWRDKQLEYSFRRALMQSYEDFSVCTRQALDYTCAFYHIDLTQEQKITLLDDYRTLPAFEDVKSSLMQLRDAGHQLYAFSNGSSQAVETLLHSAGIHEMFLRVVSANDIRSFKPNPAVYEHFLSETQALPSDSWLISSNPFDVLGALSVEMKAAWVQRSEEAIFDPWEIEPTVTINDLSQLSDCIN